MKLRAILISPAILCQKADGHSPRDHRRHLQVSSTSEKSAKASKVSSISKASIKSTKPPSKSTMAPSITKASTKPTNGANVEVSPACEDGSRVMSKHPLISDTWKAFTANLTADDAEDKCDLTIRNAVTNTCYSDYRQIVTDLNLEQTCLDNGGVFLDLNVVFECTTNQMGAAETNLNLDMKSISPLCLAQACLAEIEEYKAFVEVQMIENVRSDGYECFDSTFDFKVVEGSIPENTLTPVPAPTPAPTSSPVSDVNPTPILVVTPAPVSPMITPSPAVDTSPTPPTPPSTDSAAGGITKMSLVVGTIFSATLMMMLQ